MTEHEWLVSADPAPILAFVRQKAGDRKLRLFACACCRRIWHLLPDERCRLAVETAERFADGWATDDELERAADAASAVWDEEGQRSSVRRQSGGGLLHHPSLAAYNTATPVGWWGAAPAFVAPDEAARDALPDRKVEATAQCGLLRDIFGPLPFRPVTIDLPWQTSTVKRLAQTIYADRAFESLPVLADALEEAGCTSAEILSHCRGPGPHVRGCWALDLLYTAVDKAGPLWQAGRPLEAGRLIFEDLPAEVRPKWAARILRLVLERSSVMAGPAHLSPAGPRVRSGLERVLEVTENGQWALGHRCFGSLRASTLEYDEMQRQRGLTPEEETVAHVLSLAELVAKVTYNAADPPDPFDKDSGWWIATSLRHFVDLWQDESFSKAAWSALAREEL